MFDMKNFDFSKAMNTLMAPVENVHYDLMQGLSGIKTKEGIITLADGGICSNPLDFFSMELPAYSMLTPLDQLSVGDMIVSDGKAFAFIVDPRLEDGEEDGKEIKSIRTINIRGQMSRYVPTKVSMLGVSNGIRVAKSFMSLMGGQQNSGLFGSDMMNQILMMKILGGDNADMQSMLPLMMMGNMGNQQGMNPMMLAMMMGKNNPFSRG